MSPSPKIGVGVVFVVLGAKAPQFLAVRRIVALNERSGVDYQLGMTGAFIDRGRRPRWIGVPIRAPDFAPRVHVKSAQVAVAERIAEHDHHASIEDGRARRAPGVLRIVVLAGVNYSEVLLPDEIAFEVVTVEPLEPNDTTTWRPSVPESQRRNCCGDDEESWEHPRTPDGPRQSSRSGDRARKRAIGASRYRCGNPAHLWPPARRPNSDCC